MLSSDPIIYERPVEIQVIEVYTVEAESRETDTTETPSNDGVSVCQSVYDYGCSCIVGLRENKGVDIKGNAIDFNVDYFGDVREGDLAKFVYANNIEGHHIALVLEGYGDVWEQYECNMPAGTCRTRLVSSNPEHRKYDPAFVGFINREL